MSEEPLILIVDKSSQRLDKFVQAQLTGFSRTRVQDMIRAGCVLVDCAAQKSGYRLKRGEQVTVRILPREQTSIEPEDIALDIVYEDEDLAVINKPAGLVVHPGAGHASGTLVNALLARYPEMAQMADDKETGQRLGIAHRLDRGTSGLIAVARNAPTLLALMQQFQERRVDKRYLALLEKRPRSNTGLIDAPIARDPRQRKRMRVHREGRSAQTEFTLLDDDFQGDRALVELKLLTGRTHQIRVHMAFIGCPVVGDAVYGYRKQRVKMKRQFLHAQRLAFEHPATGERVAFECELPVGLRDVMAKLR